MKKIINSLHQTANKKQQEEFFGYLKELIKEIFRHENRLEEARNLFISSIEEVFKGKMTDGINVRLLLQYCFVIIIKEIQKRVGQKKDIVNHLKALGLNLAESRLSRLSRYRQHNDTNKIKPPTFDFFKQVYFYFLVLLDEEIFNNVSLDFPKNQDYSDLEDEMEVTVPLSPKERISALISDYDIEYQWIGSIPITKILIIHDGGSTALKIIADTLEKHDPKNLKIVIKDYDISDQTTNTSFTSVNNSLEWTNNIYIIYTEAISKDNIMLETVMDWMINNRNRSVVYVDFFPQEKNRLKNLNVRCIPQAEASYILSHLHEQANKRTSRHLHELSEAMRKIRNLRLFKLSIVIISLLLLSAIAIGCYLFKQNSINNYSIEQLKEDKYILTSANLITYQSQLAKQLGVSPNNIALSLWVSGMKQDSIFEIGSTDVFAGGLTTIIPHTFPLGMNSDSIYQGVVNYFYSTIAQRSSRLLAYHSQRKSPKKIFEIQIDSLNRDSIISKEISYAEYSVLKRDVSAFNRKILICVLLDDIFINDNDVVLCIDVNNDVKASDYLITFKGTQVIKELKTNIGKDLILKISNMVKFNFLN